MAEPQHQSSISASATQKIRFRESVEAGLFAWMQCAGDGHILRANSTLASWLGYDSPADLVGQPVGSIVQDKAVWKSWLTSKTKSLTTFQLSLRNGSKLSIKGEVRPPAKRGGDIRIVMTPEIDSALIQRTAQLEALLALTAGTVHDVNNVLTVLSGNLFLLADDLRGQDGLYEQARRARNTAKRGSSLLLELLDVNQSQDDIAKTINPGNHALALEPLLSRTLGPDNKLTLSVSQQAGSVIASAAQFESVLINLVINARDAIQKGGRIKIGIRDEYLDAANAASMELIHGAYVVVEVADNGAGIPKNILDRVTQPLFTTKAKGQGSGLGLSMVRQFAEQNNGRLAIKSVEGKGTVISIWLPRTTNLAETTANMTLPLSTLPGGTANILLVTRDPDVRSSIRQILETLGYTVESAADSHEADTLMANGADHPAIVIYDRSSNNLLNEQRWIGTLRDCYPGLRHIALLQAGADEQTHAPDADRALIRPFAVPDLAWTVRGTLKE